MIYGGFGPLSFGDKQMAQRGRPRKTPVEEVTVMVSVENLHTSKGKFLKGDEVSLPAEEAEFLQKRKQVRI